MILLLLDVTVLVWKLKNNAKYRQIDFLSFTFKPEVRSSSEMFVTQNGRIKFYSVWAILFR